MSLETTLILLRIYVLPKPSILSKNKKTHVAAGTARECVLFRPRSLLHGRELPKVAGRPQFFRREIILQLLHPGKGRDSRGPVTGIMNVDELEDYLDLQDPGLKRQIRKSHEEYRRGQARDAGKFLTGLLRTAAKSKQ